MPRPTSPKQVPFNRRLEYIYKAALFAILMAGVRAGVKALLQYAASGKAGETLGARF